MFGYFMTEPSAMAVAADIAAGKVTALEVTEACLARIAADEPRVRAFAHFDPEHARALDRLVAAGHVELAVDGHRVRLDSVA